MAERARARTRRAGLALPVLLLSVALGACRGENLFSLTATVSGSEPTVDISAPSEGSTVVVGDSVLIVADIDAPQGLTSVSYRGEYVGGGQAFISETENGGGATALAVNNRLAPAAGQTEGDVLIVVQATDNGGAQAADTVSISLAN